MVFSERLYVKTMILMTDQTRSVVFINITKNKTHICENPKKLRTKNGEIKRDEGALPTTRSGHLQKL